MLKQTKRALASTGVKTRHRTRRIHDDMPSDALLRPWKSPPSLGARAVLSSIWTDKRDYAIEKFGEVCDLAKQFGLTVDLEYVPIAGVKDLAGAVDVLRKVKRDNAGLMLDVHHFQTRPRQGRGS